jgi:hypothetical protein
MTQDQKCLTPPVLVLGYRRPDLVAEVMRTVAEAKPRQLFLACDGPHSERPEEAALVAATRAEMESAITWDCEVRLRYSDTNQGCRLGVQRAISWFFEEVDEGIILEDDCVPHPEFFPYCAQLLDRYRDDVRVMHISGDSSLLHPASGLSASYTFSKQPLVWGWATWRRSWKNYDAELRLWERIRSDSVEVRRIFGSRVAAAWWSKVLDGLLFEGKPDTWDYQWTFSVMAKQGLSIVPAVNLISNIGFREDATHTFNREASRANSATERVLPLRHPSSIHIDVRSDARFQRALHGYPPSQVARSAKRLRKSLRRGLRGISARGRMLGRLLSRGRDQ